jgi:catechol 2,3-dioxygenase-like lactoylglutathione lyase family enzyme
MPVTVRYIVADMDKAIAFYTERLGFKIEMHPAPPFAMLSLGDLRLALSQPNSSGGGGQSMGGRAPEPGGWNRFQIEVPDIEATVRELKAAGASSFRSDIITGIGGKQIVIDDPSGNPVELFQYIQQGG